MILKKTYLWAKQRKTRRLCPFTPRRPFHCPVFVFVGRFRRDFIVRSCNVKILEISKKKHKEIKKKHTCGPNNARRVVCARIHLVDPSISLISR